VVQKHNAISQIVITSTNHIPTKEEVFSGTPFPAPARRLHNV